MADSSVRAVTSNQDDIYKNLEQVVRKYATTRFLRPIADHTREAFESAKEFVKKFQNSSVILDSGCGTGESTLHIARRFPEIPVIGIDKSALRLNKAGNIHQLDNLPKPINSTGSTDSIPQNAFWVRAELLDFWRLALEEVQAGRWHVLRHTIFYPNPWPKENEAGRRFHLHPIFPTILKLSSVTELRTNWEIYAREFAEAAKVVYGSASSPAVLTSSQSSTIASSLSSAEGISIACEPFNPMYPETAFERKYKEARQQLWRVIISRQ